MNTPKVTSAKMWVGLLGNFSSHVVLQAQTYVKGKSLGVQTFVIEIRNEYLHPITQKTEAAVKCVGFRYWCKIGSRRGGQWKSPLHSQTSAKESNADEIHPGECRWNSDRTLKYIGNKIRIRFNVEFTSAVDIRFRN